MIWWLISSASGSDLVAGRYELTLHTVTRARLPVFGWTGSTTVSTVLVDLVATEDGWIQHHRVCDVQVSGDRSRATTEIPGAFIAALPVKQYVVRTSEGSYRADLGIDHIGYDPALTDHVPRSPTDLGVVDPDEDGHPGMTVRVDVPLFGSAEVYIAQRGQIELEGTIGADGAVEGRLATKRFEQRTLSASHRLFRMNLTIEPDDGRSWFRLKPAPAASCAELSATSSLEQPLPQAADLR